MEITEIRCSLVTCRSNQTELRWKDSYIKILCRFQKCKRKVPPPSPWISFLRFFPLVPQSRFWKKKKNRGELFPCIFGIYIKFVLKNHLILTPFDLVDVATFAEWLVCIWQLYINIFHNLFLPIYILVLPKKKRLGPALESKGWKLIFFWKSIYIGKGWKRASKSRNSTLCQNNSIPN